MEESSISWTEISALAEAIRALPQAKVKMKGEYPAQYLLNYLIFRISMKYRTLAISDCFVAKNGGPACVPIAERHYSTVYFFHDGFPRRSKGYVPAPPNTSCRVAGTDRGKVWLSVGPPFGQAMQRRKRSHGLLPNQRVIIRCLGHWVLW